MRVLVFLLCFSSCSREVVVTDKTFSGHWLQLDKYFADSCFILDENTHLISVFDEGEDVQTIKDDWVWEFDGIDTYVFNGEINLYVAPFENDCWRMTIWEVDVNACPCELEIPPAAE